MASVSELITQYEGFIKAGAERLARDGDEADELRQKAAIILWQQHGRVCGMNEASVRAYLGRSMKNALIDMRRRQQRLVSYDALSAEPSDDGDGFEDGVLDRLMIMPLLHALSAVEQDIVFKSYFMGMDSAAIGEALGLPPSTVRSKRMRANRKLKKLLIEKGLSV